MRLGLVLVRRAAPSVCVVAVLLVSRSSSAQAPAPGEAPPTVVREAPAALAPYWPRPTFERRSSGLLVTSVVFASVAATVIVSGGVVYGEAFDSCLDHHKSNGSQRTGHFCTADRSTFDAGMGMMVVGGAIFAIAVPLAVWAGSGTPTMVNPKPAATLGFRAGPGGGAFVGTF